MLTPEQIQEAMWLRESGGPRKGCKMGCRTIALRMGVPMKFIRRLFENNYSLYPTARDIKARSSRGWLRDRIVREQFRFGPKMAVPEHLFEERNRYFGTPHRDLTAALLGDPRPGRSALDKRGDV